MPSLSACKSLLLLPVVATCAAQTPHNLLPQRGVHKLLSCHPALPL